MLHFDHFFTSFPEDLWFLHLIHNCFFLSTSKIKQIKRLAKHTIIFINIFTMFNRAINFKSTDTYICTSLFFCTCKTNI